MPPTSRRPRPFHPVKQGLIQSLGVFVDTMIICTSTAFIILVSGPEIYDPSTSTAIEGVTLGAARARPRRGLIDRS